MTENFFQDCYVRLRLMLDERRPLDGVLGLPAFFTLILLVFMAVNSHEDSSREHLNQLERKTQNLLDQGLFAEARLSAMRVMQNGEQNSKAILMEAKALRGMGRDQDSLRLLSRIAPIERPGYAAAHVGQATILLAQKPPAFAAAQEHVRHALQSDPSDQDALELAARCGWTTAVAGHAGASGQDGAGETARPFADESHGAAIFRPRGSGD